MSNERLGSERFYGREVKRGLDLLLSVTATIVLSPLLLAIVFIIRVTSRGPVLFVQERLGRNAALFNALKFRTMTHRQRVPDTEFYKGDPNEITIVGKWLRRTKLDELPQIVNVIKGDMAIVGPRPQLAIQLQDFDENANLRLLVRPGLTGMAQVHGNVGLTWPERWYYDAAYVKNLSFALDVWIILRTVLMLILGEERFLTKPELGKSGLQE
jgi:Sugar transferases involved in lipopolysaccharide synthesis